MNYERWKNRRMPIIFIRIAIVAVILVILSAAAIAVMAVSGKNKLKNTATGNERPNLRDIDNGEALTADEEDIWEEGDVRYNGKIYRYNENIMTLLFIGTDNIDVVKTAKDSNSGGQADALFLLVMNQETKEISIIAIPRDTIADVDVYSKEDNFMASVPAQICLQYAYGNGREKSCERMVQTVSRLFYELPINGYCSINMGAIPLINDEIGGIEVTAIEDIKTDYLSCEKGDSVKLMGIAAYDYLHYRDIESFGSSMLRLSRQKQYIIKYISGAKSAVKKNPTLALKLYNTLKKYMVTDIGADEAVYLAQQAVGYSFTQENLRVLSGELILGDVQTEYLEEWQNKEDFVHEELYIDDEELYKIIIEVFYTEVSK